MDAFEYSNMSEQARHDDSTAASADDVNLDLDRAGSPVQHRRHRLRGPIIDEDDGGMASLLPPAAEVPQATVTKVNTSLLDGMQSESSLVGADEDIAFSLQPSSDDEDDGEGPLGASVDADGSGAGHFRPHRMSSDDDLRPIADTSLPASLADAAMLSAEHAMSRLENGESSGAVRDTTRAPVSSLYNSMMGVAEASMDPAQRGDDETPSCDGAFSPAPVTVLGVAHDLRRKRVKKVSHYILGPLLGEGSYGVVRDAINISADQKRFSRCAIKMLASSFTASGLVGPGTDASQNSADALTGVPNRGGRRGRRRGGDAEAEQAKSSSSTMNTTAVAHSETEGGGGGAEATSGHSSGLNPAEDHAASAAAAVGERLAPWGGKGLVRGSDARKAQEQAIFRNEINNLQRFHSKNVIRAIDVFSRYGKAYVVMPIAICSLQQFVRESIRLMREQHVLNGAHGAKGTHDDGVGTLLKPLASHVITIRDGDAGSGTGAGDAQTSSDHAALSSSGPVSGVTDLSGNATSTLSIARRLVQEEWNPAQHYLRDGALFSPILTKGFLYQLLSGVEYLHQQHIAHNDIKPSNLLLFEDGSVKLTDLGSVGATYAGQGTPLYASPELCKSYYGMEDDAVEAEEKKDENTTTSDANKKVEQNDDTQKNNNEQPHNDDSNPAPPNGMDDNTPKSSCDFNVFANDMWCCGLVFYYLITGRPGPLPVHTLYHNYHEAHRQMEEEGALHPAFHMTRWSLYREIAMQKVPVDLDNVPDLIVEPTASATANAAADAQSPPEAEELATSSENKASAGGGPAAATTTTARPATSRYPPNGARDLLSRLLDLDPTKRITAEAALQHPWVRMTFKPSKKKKEEKLPDATSAPSTTTDAVTTGDGGETKEGTTTTLKKPPSKRAMEDAIQRDVARRVLQSRHVKALTLLDRQRHLQFAADCCQILGVPLPPEILRERGTEPFEDEAHLDIALLPAATASHTPPRSGQRDDGSGASVTGTVVTYGAPEVMPEGSVDTNLFLPPEEYDYYEQKCGKNEFDVAVLRNQPAKVRQMEEYLHNVVLVQCGYRTREDPFFATNNRGTAPKALLTKMAGGSANTVPPPTTSSSSTLVIRPGGGSLSAGVGVAGTSVFSTNSSTLNQLQRQQQQQQRKHTDSVTVTTLSSSAIASLAQSGSRAAPTSREPAAAAAGVVARDDSSQESNPESPVQAAPPQSATSAATPTHASPTPRTPAQRARQSARLSEAEAVVAAQEGRTAIQESSKCLCGLM